MPTSQGPTLWIGLETGELVAPFLHVDVDRSGTFFEGAGSATIMEGVLTPDKVPQVIAAAALGTLRVALGRLSQALAPETRSVEDVKARVRALKPLAQRLKVERQAAVTLLTRAAQHEASPDIRHRAFALLMRRTLSGEFNVAAFVDSDVPDIRLAATKRATDDAARVSLENLAADEGAEASARIGAIEALENQFEDGVVAPKIAALVDCSDEAVALCALRLLANKRDARLLKVLEAGALNHTERVQFEIVAALEQAFPERAQELLLRLLESKHESVVASAASSLGLIGGPDALGRLHATKENRAASPSVLHAASHSIRQIQARIEGDAAGHVAIVQPEQQGRLSFPPEGGAVSLKTAETSGEQLGDGSGRKS